MSPILETRPRQAITVNIGGTLNVATLSSAYEAERFCVDLDRQGRQSERRYGGN